MNHLSLILIISIRIYLIKTQNDDDGVEIAEEDSDHILGRFKREDDSFLKPFIDKLKDVLKLNKKSNFI